MKPHPEPVSDAPDRSRVDRLLSFLGEMERLKKTARRNYLPDLDRAESTAEHTWHLALFVLCFEKELPRHLDRLKMLKMVLLHDLVEAYAGDTFAYDREAARDQKQRETRALQRLLQQLPEDLAAEFGRLWEEFEAGISGEAQVVRAFDKIQAIHQNLYAGWATYRRHEITLAQILELHRQPRSLNGLTASIYESIFEQAEKLGYVRPGTDPEA